MVKKSIKKIFTAALSLLLALSFLFAAGCSENEGQTGEDPAGDETTIAYGDAALTVEDSSLYSGGVHDLSMTVRSGEYLVQNGQTEYEIVYPAAATDRENTAVAELQTYFHAATGIMPDAISDAEAVWSADAKYISVGATSLVTEAGVTVDAAVLGQSGVRIVTEGDSIFLTGTADYGTLYAVYEFLGFVFDWEVFSDNVITYHTDVKEVPLWDYNVTDVPDFEFNVASHQYIRENADLRNRFRMIQLQDQAFGYTDNIYHNSLEWLPQSKYQAEHKEWYSTYTGSNANLCYYAQGDAVEYAAMVEEVARLMEERVQANLGKIYISFGIQDTQTLCGCATCNQKMEEYNGSQAAGVILFLNDVWEIFEEWFNGEGAQYYCGQKILFFAYHATNIPPVTYNEATGEYEALPIDADDPSAGVFTCENIVPWFAETNGDYTYSLLENETVNGTIAENLRGWSAISDEILFWTYGTNFSEYLTPYYSFEGFQPTYQFAAEEGVRTLYAQHQTNNTNSTGWERLKGYLNYKLGWNVNYNVNELIDRFFENYFGPAASEMQDMFEEYRVVGHLQRENGYAVRRSIFHSPFQAKYWPRSVLADWMDNIDAALAAIAPLAETDSDLYDAYYTNITTERVFPYYLMVNIYSSSLSTQTVAQYRRQIRDDCVRAGIDMYTERNGDISTLWSQWGLA